MVGVPYQNCSSPWTDQESCTVCMCFAQHTSMTILKNVSQVSSLDQQMRYFHWGLTQEQWMLTSWGFLLHHCLHHHLHSLEHSLWGWGKGGKCSGIEVWFNDLSFLVGGSMYKQLYYGNLLTLGHNERKFQNIDACCGAFFSVWEIQGAVFVHQSTISMCSLPTVKLLSSDWIDSPG